MLRRALVAQALCLTAVGLAPAQSAVADGRYRIGLTGFADIAVDESHQHVFVSQGTNDRVVVTDLDGARQQVMTGLYGARDLVLSGDASTLYVALSSGDAIAAVDTASLQVTVFPTGPSTCPTHLAVTAGLLWFSEGCGDLHIGAMDPADGTVHADLADASPSTPLLAASPALDGSLFTLDGNATLTAFDAVGGETPSLAVRASREVGDNGRDLAVTPDGTMVITASGWPYQHPAFATSDLTAAGVFATDSYPDAVAVRPDGMVAAGIDGAYEPDIYVYEAGSRRRFRAYELAGSDFTLQPGGLAFGSTRLYAVSGSYSGDYRLEVITPRKKSYVHVATDRARYAFGRKARVTVKLEAVSETREVALYATELGGRRHLVTSGTVDANGEFTTAVAVRRRTTFSAVYPGDARTDPAESAKTVAVAAKVTPSMQRYRGRSGRYYLYDASSRAFQRGTVSPNHEGDCLRFRVQYLVRGRWGYDGSTRCVTMSAKSQGWAYMDGREELVGIPIRMRAEWGGDEENLAAVSGWRYLKFTA